ncbi:4'-phosphopantetheinyl transferase family protein [Methylocystis echinoides]|uniref:4'-phosphopantetheinyl transferase n=1 Tax=Methylocystis echinoides TaxID=29468 RepID=A0A9W6GRH6_9HYPH|nr:4'-phosphopantetheinyl transferase superfamily protein [Methylocystis echinoides]GLI91561.1 4'-phosphopantetheinyl transferase [Methylocystis echinoides]
MAVCVQTLALSGIAPDSWPALADLLDDAERARAARFAFEDDRQAYVAAHALLRVTLSEMAGGAPQDWRFAAARLGKPYLIDPPKDLRFSVTHARGMVAVAIAEGVEIGVDVEPANRRAESMKLAQRFFAPEETSLLRALDGAARRDAFFAIWTLKEAVVKATGEGLSRGLDSFTIHLDPPRMTMPDDPGAWRLEHWRRGDYHLALAGRCASWDVALVEREAGALLG